MLSGTTIGGRSSATPKPNLEFELKRKNSLLHSLIWGGRCNIPIHCQTRQKGFNLELVRNTFPGMPVVETDKLDNPINVGALRMN